MPYQKRPKQAGYNKRGYAKNNKAPPAAWFDPPMKALFVGRPPIPFIPPPILDFKPPIQVTGVSTYMKYFESSKENIERVEKESKETPETKEEKNKRLRKEKIAEHDKQLKIEIEKWKKEKETKLNVKNNDAITENPMATLFVARLSYDVREDDLRELLEEYGKIKKVTLIKDVKQQGDNNNNNNSNNNSNSKATPHRGYGFVEYENEESVKVAYKRAEGLRLLGKRIRVDVERGRTVDNWLPRRLGGGKGSSRMAKKKKKTNNNTNNNQSYKDKRGRRSSKYSKHMKGRKLKKKQGGGGTKRRRE